MGKVEIKYVKSYADRHGKVRHYFRRAGQKQIPLPGNPGSAEFMRAYEAALSGKPEVMAAPGSVTALCIAYYASPGFRSLQPQTQRTYRAIIDRFKREAGDLPVAGLAPRHFRAFFDRMEHQGAANVMRKRLRHMMQFAVERDWRPDNPLLAISKPKYEPKPFVPWSEDDISAFEAHWPSGSRERLALALLLYTGQRRGDVVRMGRQHTRNGRITVTQGKTKTRLEIKIHPALKVELDKAGNDLTFLMTQLGKPFTPAGFSQWFTDRAKLAGVEERSPHGLRKAAARRLAEAGCSAHEIASITGHKSLSEVERYTRSASQTRLGDEAIDTLVRAEKGTATV